MKQIFVLLVAILLVVPIAFAGDNDTETDDIETPDAENETEEEETEDEEIEDETEEEEEDEVDNPSTGEDAVDNETEDEVTSIKDHRGAKVRLMQLEKRIIRNTVRAEGVVEYIKENYSDADVVELETLIDEMNVLKDEVHAVTTDNPDYGTVKQFVDLKNDAIELSKSFRDNAREILKDEKEIGELKKELEKREREEKELIEKHQEVLKAIREYNAHRMQVMLEVMNESDDELIEEVGEGLPAGRAMSELRKRYAALEEEEKAEVRSKLKEEVHARDKFREAGINLTKTDFLERREIRLRQRIDKPEQFEESAVASRLIAQRIDKAEVGGDIR